MKAIEFVGIRLVLLVAFAIGLSIVAVMLGWHYYRHGELPKTS